MCIRDRFINTGKAMVIIAAILLSVALAFVAGTLFMYISRLIFSFRYAAVFRRWGAVWCGISLAGILYFALFKGLKSSGLIPTSVADYVGEHVLVTLLAFWAASSVVLWLLQRMRLNIMRITILSGTFALALAFVICYNMGMMNFVERTREYSTLKVLGYHQKEIRRLIMRENAIISFLGVALGIWPGIALTNVIMHTCEPESGFYPGAPTIQSIVIACVVTYLFSELLQRLLARKVRKIDMVEALKSVE